jgi:hypothetical protein
MRLSRWPGLGAFMVLCTVSSASVARVARAQTSSATVRVRVVDTAGKPIPGVEVSVSADRSTLASRITDAAGRHSLNVPLGHAEYDLAARRIGFLRGDRFFTVSARDTFSFEMILHGTVRALDPVVVSAEVSAREKAYNIDADEIAKSSRPLFDANDIIDKLRPQMRTSRAPEVCNQSVSEPYPALSNIWVNGHRVPLLMRYIKDEEPASLVEKPPSNKAVSLADLPRPDGEWVSEQATAILHTIKPEHVAEMHYLDCYDTWMPDVNGRNALYIVLKPGIGYDFARGSYVVEQKPVQQAERVAARAAGPESLPPYRSRIIGIFAANGGAPLGGVAVVNDSAGMQVVTSPSGAASLWFLGDGESRIRLTKPGFRDTSFVVSISPADTIPITVLLETRAQVSDTSRRTPRLRR